MTTAFITGASRGIGAHAARRLAAQGVTVLAGCRTPAAADVSEENVHPIALDVTDDASVAAAVKEVEASFGALDVLVNNAGVAGTRARPADTGPDEVREVLETNVVGPVRVTHAFLPLLRASATPRLVLVSSQLGSLQLMDAGRWENWPHLAYPSSKAALNMAGLMYARTLPDVLVTIVNPGFTATEFNDYRGHQTLDEGTDALVAAVLDTEGPSGRSLSREGLTPW
ncbi:SDR family NAD(P)-dependent oxidoreductase [Actinomycetospora soli]|uniref:SDR family NAD(P)-dependent oxidoreductase n=1 Tax=Actinomycetospora soli TaxID=2893887 RepID=UPI001E4AE20E|nr:SDR family NAD(P)-dependent oxidoreductase [Actinomycetospora soli]MCD2185538.1 SDR family NAD(P)-dependent oxidoreductase [Actinomycetospora soli]